MNLKNMFKKTTDKINDFQQGGSVPVFKKIISFRKLLLWPLLLCAIVGIAFGAYYYHKYEEIKRNPDIEAQRETETLVAALGRLMELPADETPTVATITDKEKLKDQLFFAKAENGDKLLAYTKAMQAILYRPSANKIINVAPLVINQPEGANQNRPVSQTPSGLKVAYYNGTDTVGLSSHAEQKIKATYQNYQTSALTNATKKDYKETLVIDLSGTHQKEATAIAQLLGGKVSSLPDGEAKPDADILVISGK